jgi:outer membrane lipoprotein carrier protein
MRRFGVVALFVALASSSVAAASAKDAPKAPSKAERVARLKNRVEAQRVAALVQRHYRSTKRLYGHFAQTTVLAKHAVEKKQTGRLFFERPGKLSFRYDKPSGARVVSDGKEVRVYDGKAVFVAKWKRSLYPAALSFLEGRSVLPRDYRLRILDLDHERVAKGRLLEAIPKKASPVVSRLVLHVDDRTGRVWRVLVVDAQGNTNRFTLSDVVVNRAINKREFRFPSTRGKSVIRP